MLWWGRERSWGIRRERETRPYYDVEEGKKVPEELFERIVRYM